MKNSTPGDSIDARTGRHHREDQTDAGEAPAGARSDGPDQRGHGGFREASARPLPLPAAAAHADGLRARGRARDLRGLAAGHQPDGDGRAGGRVHPLGDPVRDVGPDAGRGAAAAGRRGPRLQACRRRDPRGRDRVRRSGGYRLLRRGDSGRGGADAGVAGRDRAVRRQARDAGTRGARPGPTCAARSARSSGWRGSGHRGPHARARRAFASTSRPYPPPNRIAWTSRG